METEYTEKKLTVTEKRIQIFYAGKKPAPLIIYHAVREEGKELWQACREIDTPAFSLAVVLDIAWNHEMSPWPIPPISKRDTPCSGGADAYLPKLVGDILPAVRGALPAAPTYHALCGYSLAGLFAVYAAYRTDCFQKIASASGSLWYPGLLDFVRKHPLSEQVKAIYLSLGDRESRTKNPYLMPVEENTRTLSRFWHEKGIATVFESNPGNHFQDAVPRMARGISWILGH